jgi:hypothetical protein
VCLLQYTDKYGVQQQKELFRDDYELWSGNQLDYGPLDFKFAFLIPGRLPPSVMWAEPSDMMVRR